MKVCTTCKELKSKDCFGAQSARKDGLKSICKLCLSNKRMMKENGFIKEKVKIVIVDGVESKECKECKEVKPLTKFEKGNKGYGVGGRRTECMSCRNKKPNKKRYNGEKKKSHKGKARKALQGAVKRGTIKKPTKCSICNKDTNKLDLHGHHDNYDKPLDVVWCCQRCHHQIHHGEY